jgi:two-component system C4-dicarboxylate transport response regulator DctD
MEILLIDDEAMVRDSLTEMLELEGFRVRAFADPRRALAELRPGQEAVLLTDVRMPGLDGLELLQRVQARDRELPVILMSGHGDIPMAIQAMKEGAYDFLEKPLQPEALLERLHSAMDRRRLSLQPQSPPAGEDPVARTLLGRSAPMQRLREQIRRLAAAQVDTLIYGETGTGKDVSARALHDAGPRRDKRFVAINCGAMPEHLLESELFGHEAGAFTGAQRRHIGKIEVAHGGTLFLDEIESMPLAAQIRLLRVLQERTIERVGGTDPIPVRITVIAASKADLAELSEQGRFRADLYYRLNVACLHLPPLRERKEDLAELFRFHARQAADKYQRPLPDLRPSQLARLEQHDWPGNVRELRNVAERFVLGVAGEGLNLDQPEPTADGDGNADFEQQLEGYERRLIMDSLRRHQGQINKAAEHLNLTRKTLYRKMKKYQLDKWDYRG